MKFSFFSACWYNALGMDSCRILRYFMALLEIHREQESQQPTGHQKFFGELLYRISSSEVQFATDMERLNGQIDGYEDTFLRLVDKDPTLLMRDHLDMPYHILQTATTLKRIIKNQDELGYQLWAADIDTHSSDPTTHGSGRNPFRRNGITENGMNQKPSIRGSYRNADVTPSVAVAMIRNLLGRWIPGSIITQKPTPEPTDTRALPAMPPFLVAPRSVAMAYDRNRLPKTSAWEKPEFKPTNKPDVYLHDLSPTVSLEIQLFNPADKAPLDKHQGTYRINIIMHDSDGAYAAQQQTIEKNQRIEKQVEKRLILRKLGPKGLERLLDEKDSNADDPYVDEDMPILHHTPYEVISLFLKKYGDAYTQEVNPVDEDGVSMMTFSPKHGGSTLEFRWIDDIGKINMRVIPSAEFQEYRHEKVLEIVRTALPFEIFRRLNEATPEGAFIYRDPMKENEIPGLTIHHVTQSGWKTYAPKDVYELGRRLFPLPESIEESAGHYADGGPLDTEVKYFPFKFPNSPKTLHIAWQLKEGEDKHGNKRAKIICWVQSTTIYRAQEDSHDADRKWRKTMID